MGRGERGKVWRMSDERKSRGGSESRERGRREEGVNYGREERK